ncbi:error-prone DNA polymerase [Dyella sp.]|uniref:error-prone DNA polymerase n=1 Tax=Dyella sp. TaxID=1869338 RepID=UPI002ED41B88
MSSPLPDYAELHCLSAFSFQRGASTAMELFERAAELGYKALAVTDEGSLAGIVRAKQAADATGIKLIVGSEVRIDGGPKLVLLVQDRPGYVALCRMLTAARMRAKKGQYRLMREDVVDTQGLLALWVPDEGAGAGEGDWLRQVFPQRAWIAVELHRGPDDNARLEALTDLGQRTGLPLVASGDVHMHLRSRRRLQDVMTAIRHKTTLAEAGYALFPNGERHLRTRKALGAVYRRELLEETLRIARRCTFELTREALNYTYPTELVPAGHTPATWLRQLTQEGMRWRWPQGASEEVRQTIEKELDLIGQLKYESFFLTVHDVVCFARSKDILCQGRGSAANSAVCYALGITSVNPDETKLLFGRFLSVERNEPPDIDVDFEHERREEVLQYVFDKYSRKRAALAAVAIQYRGRSAIRDVARAMGISQDLAGELAGMMDRWAVDVPIDQHLRERGFDPDTPLLRHVVDLTEQLIGFPRHLSQHPGGFVISQYPLYTMVPTENASMDDRSVIQWDKDDLEYLGLLKVDCLALGMLTAIRKTFHMLGDAHRGDWTLARILDEKRDCEKTYAMICKADTVGVFQIESRAQMAMLPRLRPEKFYDLVVEVAIVRPGPIQGDMVHPYLRRKQGLEPVEYPSEDLREVLDRTLGVPLFQEQVMKIAVVAAGYTEGQADELRRSMAAWRRNGHIERHRETLIKGMLANNYELEFAERLFRQIQGFGDYGFPESHAASFALLAYVSSWLKCHEPAAFACGLINSAPMGFYSPDQLLQDARRHGVRVLPVDVRYSDWDCTLEDLHDVSVQPAIRMGLRLVTGFREDVARAIVNARTQAAFSDVADLCRRACLDGRQSGQLADAGALRALAGHRHRARWAVAGVEPQRPLFGDVPEREEIHLPLPSVEENMLADYAMTSTTLGPHPLRLLRTRLRAQRYRGWADLQGLPHGRLVRTVGLVTLRQKPGTASGVIFMSLEDEDGTTNVVVWHDLAVRQRRVLLESRLMAVEGRLETESGVRHVIAHRLVDLSPMLGGLAVSSRDFQ